MKGRSGTGKSLRTKSPTMGPRMGRKSAPLGVRMGRKGVTMGNTYPGQIRQPNQPTGIQRLRVRRPFARKSVATSRLERQGGISTVAASVSGGKAPSPIPMRMVGPKAPTGMRRV